MEWDRAMVEFTTLAGRRVSLGHMQIGQLAELRRVTVRVECLHAEREHIWMSLSPSEARRLAALLIDHAADSGGPRPEGAPFRATTGGENNGNQSVDGREFR